MEEAEDGGDQPFSDEEERYLVRSKRAAAAERTVSATVYTSLINVDAAARLVLPEAPRGRISLC